MWMVLSLCVLEKQMNKQTKSKSLRTIWFITILTITLLSSCQVEQKEPPTTSTEGLSIEKQGYVQQGMIELFNDNLDPPLLPDNPSQADLGEDPYYQACMACHGNWGQGLTDEWREIGFQEDMNCWQSKCHAQNHPPDGFEFPREIPPVLGKGTMSRSADAQQLYDVIYDTMPWWNPGSLTEEEAINFAAYIMRSRGELPKDVILTTSNLTAFKLHYPATEIVDTAPGVTILISGLLMASIAYIWMINSSAKKKYNQDSYKK